MDRKTFEYFIESTQGNIKYTVIRVNRIYYMLNCLTEDSNLQPINFPQKIIIAVTGNFSVQKCERPCQGL